MKLAEFVKNGVVKFTVEHLARQLEEQGWERIAADKKATPQALPPEAIAKPQRKPRRKNETAK